MDKNSSLVYNICNSPEIEDNQIESQSGNVNILPTLSQLNNSFEDIDEPDKVNPVVGDTDDPDSVSCAPEVMGIENTWESGKTTLRTPNQDSNLIYCESSALDQAATEAGRDTINLLLNVVKRNDENSFGSPPASEYPIPLPGPVFDDLGCLDSDPPPIEAGPFPESDLGTLFSTEACSQDDVRDSTASPGVCGLKNMGNTCFMGAGLQCLAATPALIRFFLNRAPGEKELPHSLTDQFSTLIHKIWSGDFGILHPIEFKQALGIKHPQFKDYRQHDCQEFLALLLDNLHEQLNAASCKSVMSDVSTAPDTPRSQFEASDEKEPLAARKLVGDPVDMESPTQTMHSLDGGRSTSSESSVETRNVFRLQAIPEGIKPFKDANTRDSHDLSDEEMESANVADVAEEMMEEMVDPSKEEPTFILNINSSGTSPNNSIVTRNFPRKDSAPASVEPMLEKNNISGQFNNKPAATTCIRGFQDIFKDAKTSNVNVLVTEQEANNEIRFDSEKFPKYENVRRRDPLDTSNLTEYHNFDGKTMSVKRIKETNLFHDVLEPPDECGRSEGGSEVCFNNIKRMRLEEQEKNVRRECERRQRGMSNETANSDAEDGEIPGTSGTLSYSQAGVSEEFEADKNWEKHLNANQSVIVDTFQGQFKSTTHGSIEIQLCVQPADMCPSHMSPSCVTFVPASSKEPVKYLVILDKQGRVHNIKEELLIYMKDNPPKKMIIAEVLNNHISKALDDSTPLRHVDDTNRSIYAFEILPPTCWKKKGKKILAKDTTGELANTLVVLSSTAEDGEMEVRISGGLEGGGGDTAGVESMDDSEFQSLDLDSLTQPGLLSIGERGDGWKSCAICLEEMDKDLRRHTSCNCILCESCIDLANALVVLSSTAEDEEIEVRISSSCRHHGGDELECPMCRVIVKPDTELVPLQMTGHSKPKVRLVDVSLVFRLDNEGDGNNNQKMVKLFGHPKLVRLPNRLMGHELYEAISKVIPYNFIAPYSILFVDGQGYRCSRCMFTKHCRGCQVASEGEVLLRTQETLAVRFSEPLDNTDITFQHSSMKKLRRQEPLSLYDCLHAFSESEQLDEHNPWYCPVCQKNQCATKTLSVWRYPDFLIIYLKRFIYHDGGSIKLDNKVTFPLTGLAVTPPAILHHRNNLTYNLYACVCHYGGSSAGHYTAYSKNPRTGDWHHFNDENVAKQRPQEEDYSNAYILFYQKQGVPFDFNIPKMFTSSETSPKPNIDQLILDLDHSVERDWQQEKLAHDSES
uniref:ubiquitinyl hydrolase 1 n=1 Tax=Timema shepardi TaxID=629360 RepID=A0A7R9AU13_TIMSH|nr:unnamed protein product [Timema shepardi]